VHDIPPCGGTPRNVSHGVERRKFYKRSDPRLIGFTAAPSTSLVSERRLGLIASPFLRDRSDLGLILPGSSLLQSSFARCPGPRSAFRPHASTTCPWVSSLIAASRTRVYFSRRIPAPRCRSVLSLSQALDGFLRALARGLISSRSHVQGCLFRGFSLAAATLPHREELAPLPLSRPRSPTAKSAPTRSSLGFEAFIRVEARCFSTVMHRTAARSPPGSCSSRSSAPRAGSGLPVASALAVTACSFRFRARCPQPTSASFARGSVGSSPLQPPCSSFWAVRSAYLERAHRRVAVLSHVARFRGHDAFAPRPLSRP
jgi:hypothetical protein